MYRLLLSLFLQLLLLLPAGGCLCDPEKVRYPDLFHPGHYTEQQQHTRSFDPFSRPEIGPKIVGDRPSGSLDATPAEQRPYYVP